MGALRCHECGCVYVHEGHSDDCAETRRERYRLASADTHPKDGDAQQAPLVSGAVPHEDAGDAQVPSAQKVYPMTDSTPLERVREAIKPLVQTSWSKRADEAVDEIARAALDELPPRIPTPKMIAAAKVAVSGFPRDSAIVAIWQAMFDAAIALTQEPESRL